MDQEQLIINLWDTGLTATEIGEKIGKTRSAVLGKINRLRRRGVDIHRRADAKISPKNIKKSAPVQRKAVPRASTNQLFFEYFTTAKVEIPVIAEVAPVTTGGVNLFDLKPNGCHYIIDRREETFFYCGEVSFRRQMCKAHHARCYYTPRKPD